MSQVMLDYRCPKCNEPVVGHEEVKHVKRLPAVKQCQNCKTKVRIQHTEEDLGPEAYFDYDPR